MFEFLAPSQVNDRQARLNLKTYEYAIVIGVGGIGSWVALDLALSGKVNNIVMYDDDEVEDSNLNRTPFKCCHVGTQKVLAMKELILERRPMIVTYAFRRRFNESEAEDLKNMITSKSGTKIKTNCVIVDCRDDSYQDINSFECKAWKVGYNGLELTIDGNPRETVVMGESRGYEVTPSFLLPSQFIANLVVTNILVEKTWFESSEKYNSLNDEYGQFKGILTFNITDLIYDIHMLYNEKVLECQQDQ